jgi:AraC family transcriptional regulator, transcriptional activator of pobA
MMTSNALTLINPQNGNLAFKIFSFENNVVFDHIQRLNYYSLIWITKGSGKVKVDFSEYDFEENRLFAFSPYQPFMFSSKEKLEGTVIQFHSDFYCIHMHQKEVACNGVLFDNIYKPPFTYINPEAALNLNLILNQMKSEMLNQSLAQYEMLVSFLKIFLINASRLKTEQQPEVTVPKEGLREPFILQNLKNAIEKDFKTKHSASDYANYLNITTTSLAKLTKSYFNKTLTDLISERIIIEAKRELYMTNKTVKEIAFELGYNDEHYFSRFFKNNADVSPQMYRETVGKSN